MFAFCSIWLYTPKPRVLRRSSDLALFLFRSGDADGIYSRSPCLLQKLCRRVDSGTCSDNIINKDIFARNTSIVLQLVGCVGIQLSLKGVPMFFRVF